MRFRSVGLTSHRTRPRVCSQRCLYLRQQILKPSRAASSMAVEVGRFLAPKTTSVTYGRDPGLGGWCAPFAWRHLAGRAIETNTFRIGNVRHWRRMTSQQESIRGCVRLRWLNFFIAKLQGRCLFSSPQWRQKREYASSSIYWSQKLHPAGVCTAHRFWCTNIILSNRDEMGALLKLLLPLGLRLLSAAKTSLRVMTIVFYLMSSVSCLIENPVLIYGHWKEKTGCNFNMYQYIVSTCHGHWKVFLMFYQKKVARKGSDASSNGVPCISAPLASFFTQYPSFDNDPKCSSSKEFCRMCEFSDWERSDAEREDAHEEFKSALVQQFNALYGTNADDIQSWHRLCLALDIEPLPEVFKEAREVCIHIDQTKSTPLMVDISMFGRY